MNEDDKLMHWLESHPYTLGYIAVIVTITFILQLGEVLFK